MSSRSRRRRSKSRSLCCVVVVRGNRSPSDGAVSAFKRRYGDGK